ncbi:MAG: TonB-dependent receptor [Bacteroidota bacterium]
MVTTRLQQLLFIVGLFAMCTSLQAQNDNDCNYELKGIILDADTKEALPYVSVVVKGTQKFALTDEEGAFLIEEVCDPNSTLVISCLGYCDTTCQNYYESSDKPYIYLHKEVNALEAVTITAGRQKAEGTVSIAQQIVSKDMLSADPTNSLASAISAINGVTFTSTGNNVQLPVIHGLYGNRVLVLNNGIKHGFQNWGTDHAPEIDISTANSVTVLKGAAGVRYGPEAIGGAIIVEADPLYLRKPFKSKVGTGYQTNGRGYFLNAEIGEGLDNWSYHLGANYTRIGDRHAPDYSLTNTGKQEIAANGGLRYKVKDFDFKVYYSYLSQNLGLLRSSVVESGTAMIRAFNSDEPNIINDFSYNINEPNQLVQHHLAKVETSWMYADDAKLTFRIGSQLNQREEYDVRRNADLPIIDLDLITNDFQLDWEHPEWMGIDGIIGLQFFTQNNDNNPGTNTTPFIPNYNTTRFSAFIVENLRSDRNTLELGIRLDHEYNNVRGRDDRQNIFRDEYNFTNVTASLGYILDISGDNSHTFRTNLATAWRTPNMAELYSFGQHGFKTSFGLLRYYEDESETGIIRTDRVTPLEESDVTPERGYKWINEWRSQLGASTFTVTAYANYIQDFIFDRPLAVIGTIRGPMPVFIYDQADALFLGTDISWQKRWSSTLNGTLGISYLWSQNLKKDEPLINQPPIAINYELAWDVPAFWPGTSSKLSIRPSYTFEQFQAPRTIQPEDLIEGVVPITLESEIFDFKDAPEGYFLLDLAWQLQLGSVNAGLAVQNVFNTRYRNYLNEMRYFADEPGINFLFTINYSFNSKSN